MKKILILLFIIFPMTSFALKTADPNKAPVKEEEKKPEKKKPKVKKVKGRFFNFVGIRPPIDDIYGANLELGYFLYKGRLRSYVTVLLEHYQIEKKNVVAGETSTEKYGAAQLGFKAGIAYPINWKHGGFAPFINVGSLKSSVQKEPWLGDRDNAVSIKNVIFGELGTFVYSDPLIFGFHARFSNSVVASFDPFFSIGFAY
jgi:hypothetical protein